MNPAVRAVGTVGTGESPSSGLTAAVAGAINVLEVAARADDAAGVPALVGELRRLEAIAWARLAVPATNGGEGDRLLTLQEAAAQLGVPGGWLKKRPDLPFRVVLSEGTVRYSTHGIAAYIRARCRAG